MALTKIRRLFSLPFYDKLTLAGLWLYRLKGILLYRWVFKSFGRRSAIYPPTLIGYPMFIYIGDRVTIRNGVRLQAVVSKPGREPILRIGNNVLIEQNVHIVCHSRVIIGSNVTIAGHCAIVDITHPMTNRNPSINAGSQIVDDDSPVEIGDGVFIGFGAVILSGVSIGECSVIGANSVVTRNIPAYCAAAGTRLARQLLRHGHAVTLLDNFSPQIHGDSALLPADLAPHVRLVEGDVRNPEAWKQTLPGHDAIVNLAAETGTGQSMYEVARYEQVNLAGTALLYDTLAKTPGHGVERIVVASSRAIYGEGAYRCLEHGTVYPAPRSNADNYGLTKQVQEQMTLLFAHVFAIPSFALRYQNVYGPGQSLKNPYTGILAIFSNLARVGAGINVFEDGEETRDFVYIEDVVRATVACVESIAPSSHAINIGSNERVSVMEVAQAVNRYFGGKSSVTVSGAFREGDIRHGLADTDRAKELLGYEPRWKFQDGLRQFLAWTEQSEPELAGYERSLEEMKSRGLLHIG